MVTDGKFSYSQSQIDGMYWDFLFCLDPQDFPGYPCTPISQSHPPESSSTAQLPLMGYDLCPNSFVASFQDPFCSILSLLLSLCLWLLSPVTLTQPGIFGAHQLGHSAPVPPPPCQLAFHFLIWFKSLELFNELETKICNFWAPSFENFLFKHPPCLNSFPRHF